MRAMRARGMLLAAALAAAPGCEESTAPGEDEEFILTVWVTDEAEVPRAGMHVGRINHLEGDLPDPPGAPADRGAGGPAPPSPDSLWLSYPNPFNGVTIARFSTADVREATLEVADWRGRFVETVHEGRITAGLHEVQWDQRDSSGERVITGVYRLRLSLCDTLQEHAFCHRDSIECAVYDFLDPNRSSMGTTDDTGFFSTRDLDLFPSLQGHGPQAAYDGTADPLGHFSFSGTVTIRIATAPDPVTGTVYLMSRDLVLADAPNFRHFVFAPDDSIVVPQAR